MNSTYKFLFVDKTLGSFLTWQFAQFTVLLGFMYLVFPSVWHAQVDRGLLTLLLTFLVLHFLVSVFEFFFHRYVLHLVSIKTLSSFTRKHRKHHSLTPVMKTDYHSSFRVLNDFPIMKEEQREHSVFPDWALVGFSLFATPFIFALQWFLPAFPIILAGYSAVFISYIGYEIIHAFEHRSYAEWWKPRVEHPRYGRIWERLYSFHVMHHANPACNEAVAGFLGLPVTDWILGTYKRPSKLLLDGVVTGKEDFEAPHGSFIIRALDRAIGITLKKA